MFAQPRGAVPQHARDAERRRLCPPRGYVLAPACSCRAPLTSLADIEHFIAHEEIEAEEEARAREFTGGESDAHNHATEQKIFKGDDEDDDRIADEAEKPLASPAEEARNERAAYARAQAAKFSK